MGNRGSGVLPGGNRDTEDKFGSTWFLNRVRYTLTEAGWKGDAMAVYLDLAVLLNFVVDLLLILGTNRITGDEPGLGRAAAGAFLGAVYAAASLLPGFRFLGNLLWKCVSLCMVCFCAFGLGKRMLRRGAIFVFLSMALGGIAQAMGRGGIGALMAAAAGVLGLCVLGCGRLLVNRSLLTGGLTAITANGGSICDLCAAIGTIHRDSSVLFL